MSEDLGTVVRWGENDRRVFDAAVAAAEAGDGVPREAWAAYVAHVTAEAPKEADRERRLRTAAIVCSEIDFTGRLIREAREGHEVAARTLAFMESRRQGRAQVDAARDQVKRWEGYILGIQAVQQNLGTGNILAAFVNAFSPPLLQTPPQVKAKVNGRPATYNQRLADGLARWLWTENPDMPTITVVDLIAKENPAEFGSHKSALRRHLGKVRAHLLPPGRC